MNSNEHFMPFGREHKQLTDINDGKKHIPIIMDRIQELADGDPADVIAQEIYEAEIASQGSFKAYVVVREPEVVDETWIIHKNLSVKGQAAHDSLKAGVLWHIHGAYPDYEATKTYYRKMMEKGQIEMRFVDLLTETKSDELRDLRNELVYFKLRGQKKGEIIYGMVDAA